MNEYDVSNALKILALREALNFDFDKRGVYSRDELDAMSTDQINQRIKDYEKNSHEFAMNYVRKKVNEIFDKFGQEGDNMIILSACGRYDYSLYGMDGDEMIDSTNWKWEKYNQLCHPVISDTDEFYDALEDLQDTLTKAKIKWFYRDFYDDGEDGINEFWNGYVAITKDFNIVSFIMRNDGMLQREDKFRTSIKL